MANVDLKPGVRADEITMMSNPNRWPNLVLPVKRRSGVDRQYGTMVYVEGFVHYVFFELIFSAGSVMKQIQYILDHGESDPSGVKFIKYNSYEEIVDDGWQID